MYKTDHIIMNSIQFDILVSQPFINLLKETNNAITYIISNGESNLRPQSTKRPTPAPSPSFVEDAHVNQLITHQLRINSSVNAQGQHYGIKKLSGSELRVRMSPQDCFRYPRRIQLNQLNRLTPEQHQSWAGGIILAYLQGYKANKRVNALIWPDDKLPISGVILTRCQRMIRAMRKQYGIPPVDGLTGKIKQKSTSVMSNGGKSAISKEKEQQWLADYRGILKEVLKRYNDQFELKFGREPAKEDKEVLRTLYMEYKQLKQFIASDFEDKSQQIQDAGLKSQINTLLQLKQNAQQLLQKVVPKDQAGLKIFKKEVQKCLFSYKEQYDKCIANIQLIKTQTGKQPAGFGTNWAQGFIEVYNLLFTAYEKLKAQIK